MAERSKQRELAPTVKVLHDQGITLANIAKQLGVSISTASRALAEVEGRIPDSIESLKYQQYLHLVDMRDEARAAWEASKVFKRRKLTEIKGDSGTSSVTEVEQEHGDPRLLSLMVDIETAIDDLLGLLPKTGSTTNIGVMGAGADGQIVIKTSWSSGAKPVATKEVEIEGQTLQSLPPPSDPVDPVEPVE